MDTQIEKSLQLIVLGNGQVYAMAKSEVSDFVEDYSGPNE